MSELFLKVVNMSISAGWLVLAVLLLRLILKKAPKRIFVFLWGIVGVRLICPFSVQSAFSLIPSAETIPSDLGMDITPTINSGIGMIDDIVEPMLARSNTPMTGASVNPMQITVAVCGYLWLLGMLVAALYTIVSYLKLHRRVATAVRYRDNIFQSENVDSPFVFGIVKPRIYLPIKPDVKSLDSVIAHEQAHISRKDHIWKPLGFLLLTVYWFDPLIWLSYILLCRDIELACDESVIAELGGEQRADYTEALVACSVSRRAVSVCPLAFGEVGLRERVRSVMNYEKPSTPVVRLSVALCIVVAVCFLTDPIQEHGVGSSVSAFAEGTIFDVPTDTVNVVTVESGKADSYYLTIGEEGVMSIELTTPDSSGGCVNADGSLFKRGERILLESLNGYADLRGVTIAALDENGATLWNVSIPDNEENVGFCHLVIGEWEVSNTKK